MLSSVSAFFSSLSLFFFTYSLFIALLTANAVLCVSVSVWSVKGKEKGKTWRHQFKRRRRAVTHSSDIQIPGSLFFFSFPAGKDHGLREFSSSTRHIFSTPNIILKISTLPMFISSSLFVPSFFYTIQLRIFFSELLLLCCGWFDDLWSRRFVCIEFVVVLVVSVVVQQRRRLVFFICNFDLCRTN